MLDGGTTLLKNFWYLALPGSALRPGRMTAKQLLGERLLLGRASDGAVFALRDICPHRGIPLTYGDFDGQEVACSYHGWRFGTDGRCTAVPSLVPGQKLDYGRIKVASYPCKEVQGNIWVYVPADRRRSAAELEAAGLPPVPAAPGLGERAPQVSISSPFPCHTDHAAFGLMDPTHAAFVHVSWWWKRQARKLRPKEKQFEPSPLGWRMVRHKLPSEHRAYRLLGRNVSTEITYALPGLRFELVEGERHQVVSLTAITPLDDETTEVHQCLYWTIGWLGPFRPMIKHLAKTFLSQDRLVVVRQQEGLAHDPALLLIDDADTQAKWYAKLKRAWLAAEAEGKPFENPLKATTLRWRS